MGSKQQKNGWWVWVWSCVFLSSFVSAQVLKRPTPRPRLALTANLESSGKQYLLTLENESAVEFRGTARLSLGKEGQQAEAGQLFVELSAKATRALLLSPSGVNGDQYTLQIFDQWGGLVFYKAAPIRPVASGALQNAQAARLISGPLGVTESANVPTLPPPAVNEPPSPEVQLKARLVAGAQEADAFLLTFDLVATNALLNAKLDLTIGKTKQSKSVNINKHAVVEFSLPETLETNQISYKLTRKDGSVVIEGSTDLDKLYGDDHVTVSDIRPDRVAYSPGEVARVTVVLEGQSPHGFRLEVTAKDYSSSTFFSDTVTGGAGEQAKERAFSFVMPNDVKGPVLFEFKVYDGETGLLFDSGERDITIKEVKS